MEKKGKRQFDPLTEQESDEANRQREDDRGAAPVLGEGEKVGPWTEDDEEEQLDALPDDEGDDEAGYQASPPPIPRR